VDAAIKVHRTFGPGLLESVYEASLERELAMRGFQVERQIAVPVVYEGTDIGLGFRIDLRIGGRVIIEVKAVESLQRVHEAQVLTYLKLTGLRLAYLMNFNVPFLRTGIKRLVL